MNDTQLKEKISKMTLREKIMQLMQVNVSSFYNVGEAVVTGISKNGNLSREELWQVGTVLNCTDAESTLELRQLRKGKGINDPVINMLDVIHGYRTIFSVPVALACSFDITLIEDCAEVAAIEAKYDGVDVTFSPMVDLCRDARWGRVMESAGEDAYLAGEIGKAYIRGYHKGGLACCVKHFAAYGAAEGGRDYDTTCVSERDLKEFYLKAYRECLKENPEMVMMSFNLLNGIPILGHREFVVDMLRNEWGFDGVLISDYASVMEMIEHGYAEDEKRCAEIAMNAKLDIEMCSPCYAENLSELVEEGKIREEDIDESVLRVLRLKNKLGMYENPDRFTDIDKRNAVTLSKEFRNLARTAAEKSCVLLKNDGVLPLEKNKKIALIGPFAEEKQIYGAWGCRGKAEETVSVKEGVEDLLGRGVLSAKGCGFGYFDNDESGFVEAEKAALKSDIVVACVGEFMHQSGEAHARAKIELPEIQFKLLKKLKDTGKKLVFVVFGGRPLALSEAEKLADAILYVWQPGTEGGNAVANILYGEVNPSGKTVMSFPRSSGQCPIYYNHFLSGRPRLDERPSAMLEKFAYYVGYDDEYYTPLYPFGYGLSYTKFEYSDLKLNRGAMDRGGKITASVKVKNTGKRAGVETVQWYIRDKFASVVRPVKELKGFEKINLEVGEEKKVTFIIDESKLAFYTADGDFKSESGEFILYVGGDSENCLERNFILE